MDVPAFIDRRTLMQALGVKSEHTVRRLIALEKLPPPVDLGAGLLRWPATVLDDLAKRHKAGAAG
ncbi:MAG: hypothetical protein P4L80_12065 [Xanthobacteraceae bacterium]|nr:hypothetical protein [Xanthobacteraceae bacterium]